jgi:hypothetical protein
MRWVPPGGCGRRLAYVRACDNKGWSVLSDGGCDISRVLERASAVNELARSVATRETDLLRAASIVNVIRSDMERLAERHEATGWTTD